MPGLKEEPPLSCVLRRQLNSDAVTALSKAGVDANTIYNDGRTAYDIAPSWPDSLPHRKIAQILRPHMT